MSDQTVANLKKVLAVNAKINSTLNLDELLGVIMTVAAEVMDTEASSLMLVDEASQELVFRVALGEKGRDLVEKFRLKIGEGIGGHVAKTGDSVIVNDPQNDPRFAKRFDKATGFSTQAIVCVPVKIRGKVTGVLQAINPRGRKIFAPEDLELFETFSEQAALSLENARIHGELIRQEKTKQELLIARDIQQNFLPDLTEKNFPADIAAESLPALEVGGDFYDVLPLDGRRTGLVIGDVSGKGVPAALYMVRVISEYRFLAPRCKGPAELLTALNQSLAAKTQRGMFVTLLCLFVENDSGKLHYGLAGHLPLLKRSVSGETAFLGDASGLPLGLMPEAEYSEASLQTSPGDLFLFYTDGVTEARNIKGQEFGAESLENFIKNSNGSAKESVQGLIAHLQKFTSGAPQHDDTTALALRIP